MSKKQDKAEARRNELVKELDAALLSYKNLLSSILDETSFTIEFRVLDAPNSIWQSVEEGFTAWDLKNEEYRLK